MTRPRLALRAVDVTRGATRALEGASLALEEGEFVGLVGPNGAGKSTLLRAAAGLLAPSAGEILLDGAPIASLPRRAVARRIAYLPPASATSLDVRVRDVVALGRLPHLGPTEPLGASDHAAIEAALDEVGARGLAERPFRALSEGERQRVVLARALAQDTDVLLLDEPTSALDARHAWSLVERVRARTRRRGAALAAIHDLALAARRCDRVVVVAEGRIVADGHPEDALSPARVASVWGMRARLDAGAEGLTLSLLGPASDDAHTPHEPR